MDSSFSELYQNYRQDIYHFLYYMVGNREHAEDLVQEVFIRVLKSYARFEGKSSEKTWLLSIARNTAIDFLRKQMGWKRNIVEKIDWQLEQIKDENPIPDEIAIQKERINWIFYCLSHCSKDQKKVIIFRFIYDFSIAETAIALGWSESKVKTTQHRSLKVIRNHLELLDKNISG